MSGPKRAWRVVFDTNVVLSALLFRQGRLAILRQLWQSGPCKPVASMATVTELTRVLGYAKFRLDASAIHAALNLYVPHVEVHAPNRSARWFAHVPQCRDPKDQMFLDLAQSATADFLVTGDEDLLVLDDPIGRHSPFRIVTPSDFLALMEGGR